MIGNSNSSVLHSLAVIALFSFTLAVGAQQVPDKEFKPAIAEPTYAAGKGPVVCIDAAHFNFHTLDGRFSAFAELLRRDGYVVRANSAKFAAGSLEPCGVMVIANAQPNGAGWNSYGYPTPSAFSNDEIEPAYEWVKKGGRLLLIADHMPLAGAAAKLAAAFDVTFNDGFAFEGFSSESERNAAMSRPTIFRRTDGTLRDHEVVRGRNAKESVTSIRSFTGQAFQIPKNAEPIMILPEKFISLMPTMAWQFGPETKRVEVGGWSQGAVMAVGDGKAGFFGEAAMFTAQIAGPERFPVGMNAPGAEQNPQFVLNLMRWLTAKH